MEDIHANIFFEMCQQVGGPRLLLSKPRGNRTDPSSGSKNPIASAPKSTNDVDAADIDTAETEGQVCGGSGCMSSDGVERRHNLRANFVRKLCLTSVLGGSYKKKARTMS